MGFPAALLTNLAQRGAPEGEADLLFYLLFDRSFTSQLMEPGREDARAQSDEIMKRIHVGSRVRITDETILHAALRWPAERRPEPGQMLWAGRDASVTGYQRGAGNRSLYALKGAPGLWPEEWLDPI